MPDGVTIAQEETARGRPWLRRLVSAKSNSVPATRDKVYFSVAHDPTTLNRQGPDVGSQYRSVVFYRNERVTVRYIAQLNAAKAFPSSIVTEVRPPTGFYPAEAYHQNYATLHPDSPYIAMFDLPKIAKLKTTLPQLYRDQPVLVPAKT